MWYDVLRAIIYFNLLFGTLRLSLFGTSFSTAPTTSFVSLVLALVVSFGTLALKSVDIAKVALVLNQSCHSATPRSYFDRTRATFSRRGRFNEPPPRPPPISSLPSLDRHNPVNSAAMSPTDTRTLIALALPITSNALPTALANERVFASPCLRHCKGANGLA